MTEVIKTLGDVSTIAAVLAIVLILGLGAIKLAKSIYHDFSQVSQQGNTAWAQMANSMTEAIKELTATLRDMREDSRVSRAHVTMKLDVMDDKLDNINNKLDLL